MFRFVLLRHSGVSIFESFQCTIDGSKAPGERHIETYCVRPFPCTVQSSIVSISCFRDNKAATRRRSMEIRVLGLYLCECDDGQMPVEFKRVQGGT